MRVEDFELISNRRLTRDYFVIDLLGKGRLEKILPGQFVQVRVDNNRDTFLRRPISVYDVDYENNIIRLLIKEVGKGTGAIAKLNTGSSVNIIYPLGNSFSIGDKGSKSLLVGGGVGVAPLFLLARSLKNKLLDFKFILGYQTAEHIIEIEKYSELGQVLITTDDGSYGHKGLVVEHPELHEGDCDRIYCCGPEPMMKSVASIAKSRNLFCEVSLENTMACGFGVCLCCVVETTRGVINTCTEGPVFNINELKWQI